MKKTISRAIQAVSLVTAATLVALPAYAHSDDESGFSFGQPAKPSQVDRTVKINMQNMRFTPGNIEVGVGETIRFVVSNSDSVEHELVIGDAPSEAAHRKEMVEMMNMGHSMQHADPNAVAVGPGQTKSLIWQFTKAGKLEFDCNVPGHYEAGMAGAIQVSGKSSEK